MAGDSLPSPLANSHSCCTLLSSFVNSQSNLIMTSTYLPHLPLSGLFFRNWVDCKTGDIWVWRKIWNWHISRLSIPFLMRWRTSHNNVMWNAPTNFSWRVVHTFRLFTECQSSAETFATRMRFPTISARRYEKKNTKTTSPWRQPCTRDGQLIKEAVLNASWEVYAWIIRSRSLSSLTSQYGGGGTDAA